MTAPFATFTADLAKYEKQLGDKTRLFCQGFTQTVFNEIQTGGKYSPGTPIKTGFARANWQGGIGSASGPPATSPGEAQAANDAVALSVQPGETVVLENNAPYIRALEFGSSKQAPAGFVRLTLAAGQLIADEVAAHVLRTR